MAIVSIQIKNQAKILNAFRQAPNIMARKFKEALYKLGGYTVGEVKKHITAGTDMWKPPIRTGAMRRGVSVTTSEQNRVIIQPSAITPYAFFVHGGTKYMRARPFFDITAKRSRKDIEKFMNRALDNAVKEITDKTR